MYKCNIEARSRNRCHRGKAISITQTEFMCVCVFVALSIQQAKHMRRVILSFVVCLSVPRFSTLPHKRHHFRDKVTEHKVYCLIFATTLSETFLILRKSARYECTYVLM
jgi:hypothetical protein